MTRAGALPGDAAERWPGLFASDAVCALEGCGAHFRKKAFTGRLYCGDGCAAVARREKAREWYRRKKEREAAGLGETGADESATTKAEVQA